nr:hypothetical protein Iba_chr11aCG10460 [Ipomoea batatas]
MSIPNLKLSPSPRPKPKVSKSSPTVSGPTSKVSKSPPIPRVPKPVAFQPILLNDDLWDSWEKHSNWSSHAIGSSDAVPKYLEPPSLIAHRAHDVGTGLENDILIHRREINRLEVRHATLMARGERSCFGSDDATGYFVEGSTHMVKFKCGFSFSRLPGPNPGAPSESASTWHLIYKELFDGFLNHSSTLKLEVADLCSD